MTNKATQIIQEWLCTNESHGYIDSGSGKRIVHCYMEGLIELFDKREKEIQKNIGALRQYLNERTSKDLITNEEIETFLNI
jgi:hypothetical protein